MDIVKKVRLIKGNIVYLFSIAGITNHYKLCDLQQYKYIILQFWGQKPNMGLNELKSKY